MPSIGDIVLTVAPYIIGFLLALVGFIVYSLSKQKRIFDFLGIDKKSKQVVIYLSSLLVPPGNAIGFDGLPRSYQGIAIPTGELNISSRLSKELTIDAFEYIPPVVRKSLQEKYAFFRPLKIRIEASPMRDSDIDFSTRSIFTVGSQGYNIVTNYCVSQNLAQLRITQNGTVIEIAKGKDAGETIRRASNQHDIAILEKLIDHTRNDTVVIIAAGLGVLGTMGAVQYFVDHWQELYKTYGKHEFALALQFTAKSNSLDNALQGSVIRRVPEK
jgi:Ca2+/Na+ antiporter